MNSRYHSLTASIEKIPAHQRVILRADGNVPLKNGTIADDYRLQALVPTLAKLHAIKATIIFITHIGNPTAEDQKISTQLLVPWFIKQGFAARHAATIRQAHAMSAEHRQEIIVLENSRFFAGEKKGDYSFAQEIAQCGDYFVFDAFATAHRNDTTIALLPTLFPTERRTIGLLVEREIHSLGHLLQNISKVFALCGGGKVSTKLPFIETFLKNGAAVALLPALVFTFLKSEKKQIGISLADDSFIHSAHTVMDDKRFKEKLILPKDYLVATGNVSGPLCIREQDNLQSTDLGISIGPKTIATLKNEILKAQYIFFNAAAGFAHRPETLNPMIEILQAIAASNAWSVIGGGDSARLAMQAGVAANIDFLSTGGGATLAFLACQKMPGLEPFVMQQGSN